jgi:hypothetical protein
MKLFQISLERTLLPCSSRLFYPGILAALIIALSTCAALAADIQNTTPSATAGNKLPKTVGLNIVKKTVNSDKTISLDFKWNEKGKPMERTVILNDKTIVVYNGELKKFAELTDEDLHAKAVATVGADDKTAVLLRFGKAPVPKEKLTPEQSALLASLAPPATAASDVALEKRVNSVVDGLELKDNAKRERVRAVIATDLRAVRDAHNAGLQLDPTVHKTFVTGLEAELTPEQVEAVKDKLTVNKVPITFKTYHQIIPQLTAEDDAKILGWLKQAREESLYVKNVDEMNPIFKKYKKEIEHYIDSRGYDWAKSYKAFVDKQKTGLR